MSYILLDSGTKQAKIHGSERYLMFGLVRDIAIGVFEAKIWNGLGIQSKIETVCRLLDLPKDSSIDRIKLHLRSLENHQFQFSSRFIKVLDVVLNTALKVGNDVIKLAARLDGQCEIHCYVEGKNRQWLANIIVRGLKKGLFRETLDSEPQGWREAIALLEESDREPVICSYSVSGNFPGTVCWLEEGTREELWEKGLNELRSTHGLELTPDNWDDYYFSQGFDFFFLGEWLELDEGDRDVVMQHFLDAQLLPVPAWKEATKNLPNPNV